MVNQAQVRDVNWWKIHKVSVVIVLCSLFYEPVSISAYVMSALGVACERI
jgi:hypothetical protein